MHIVQQTNKYKWWLYALFISVSSYHRTIYIRFTKRLCWHWSRTGSWTRGCRLWGWRWGSSGDPRKWHRPIPIHRWRHRPMGRQSLPATRNKKKQCEKTQFLTSFKKGMKEYTFVSALNIKSAKNKTFIDIWFFFSLQRPLGDILRCRRRCCRCRHRRGVPPEGTGDRSVPGRCDSYCGWWRWSGPPGGRWGDFHLTIHSIKGLKVLA